MIAASNHCVEFWKVLQIAQTHDRSWIGATLMTDMSLTYESDVTARSGYGAP